MPICRQREVIELSHKEMFGCGLIADPTRTGPPSLMIQLKIDDLRAVALRALNRMNLSPA
ncbi:unnamed protein product [Penicillium camemberti]|uniref:Str. FM013 n=1 Tax=Penicillium camemberti (strain FM 013) TaxID=1429867 RepID=A0A0G4NVH0_PENC3|nr:unnamed protein product [Penicillium camemberti]